MSAGDLILAAVIANRTARGLSLKCWGAEGFTEESPHTRHAESAEQRDKLEAEVEQERLWKREANTKLSVAEARLSALEGAARALVFATDIIGQTSRHQAAKAAVLAALNPTLPETTDER